MTSLYDPLLVGDIALANRIVMAPLTRNRAGAGQVPTDLMRQYYRQRANPATGAGLIITEARQISPMGQGYLDTPSVQRAPFGDDLRQVRALRDGLRVVERDVVHDGTRQAHRRFVLLDEAHASVVPRTWPAWGASCERP